MNTNLNDYDYSSSDSSDDYENEENANKHLNLFIKAPDKRKTFPKQRHFLIFCSNRGVVHICNGVYKNLCQYDSAFRRQTNITELQLQYVTTIAYINRMVQCAIKNGYNMCEEDTKSLEDLANSIMLPPFLTKYIESLGVYRMRSGISVAPWVADYKKLFAFELEQRSPEQILHDAEREIPDNTWKLDREWIINFNQANFPSKYKFTKVDNRNFVGKVEMIITHQSPHLADADNICVLTSPQNAYDEEARLGALYEWRSRVNEGKWPGHSSLVLTNCIHGKCYRCHFSFGEPEDYEYAQNESPKEGSSGSKQSNRFRKGPKNQKTTKELHSKAISIFPNQDCFWIFCSNRGVERICKLIFNGLKNLDSSFKRNITELQLQYVTTIAYVNRLVQCNLFRCGYNGTRDILMLREEADDIQLPLFLTKYIESLGAYQMKSGILVVPWVAEYEELFAPLLEQRSPEQILLAAGKDIPDNSWKLDKKWIREFNVGCSRIRYKYPSAFAKVDNTKLKGKVEMIITPEDKKHNFLPTAPEISSYDEAELGSFYEWRSRENEENWPEKSSEILVDVFQGIEYSKYDHHTLP